MTTAERVLVDNYTNFLAFLERRLGSREVAEDILHDAFVRSIGRLSELRRDESAVAWFYRVLRNALADHYRRRGARLRAQDRAAALEERHEDAPDDELFREVCTCVGGLLDALKPEYGRALRRVDLEGEKVADWAREEGITASAAGVRLHRARRALRRDVVRSCATCTEHACLDCTCKAEGLPAGVEPRS